MPTDADLLNDRVDLFFDALKERYHYYIGMFFPEVAGARQPIFTERITDREEFLRLRELANAAIAVQSGQPPAADVDPNMVQRFMTDPQAQARFAELAQKFEADLNAGT